MKPEVNGKIVFTMQTSASIHRAGCDLDNLTSTMVKYSS